ncbi:hypothetical protein ACFJIX_18170 [Roseateles sp. UC29_93]|uniref:hypothetical protein n=1 Tax=Roseateles sp. UC29_93 TaxID=3350177 RepID=UPI00366CCAAD
MSVPRAVITTGLFSARATITAATPSGIEVVRVDQVEVVARRLQLPRRAQEGPGQRVRRAAHADLGQPHEARMRDVQAVPRFARRRRGELAVLAEALALEREPRHRRDDAGFSLT